MDSNQIVPTQGENPYELDTDAIERFLKSPDLIYPTGNNSGLKIELASDPTQTSVVDVPDPDDPMTWNLDFCLEFPDEIIPCQGTTTMGVDQLGSVDDSGDKCKEKSPAGLGSPSDYETQRPYYWYYEDTSIPGGEMETEEVPLVSVNANTLNAALPQPFNCSFCQVLREIVHSDGGRITTKLEILGNVGMIFHAILESHQYFTDCPLESYFQIFDLTGKSLEEVKQLTKEYCIGRERKGFFMEQDNYSNSMELCALDMTGMTFWKFTPPLPLKNSSRSSRHWWKKHIYCLYCTFIGSKFV